jgi:hypothetical protein
VAVDLPFESQGVRGTLGVLVHGTHSSQTSM